jgi:A/G-specific adenine glycosylase
VGDYIAAAVLSIALNKPHAVVDGNVKRVLARLNQIEAPINRSISQRQYQALAEALLDRHHPGIFNQALMELGALVCRAVNPACLECPLSCYCRAKANAMVAEYPRRIKPPPVPHRHLAMGVVVKNNQLLVVRRPENGLLGGLWEFPNQVVQADQTPRTACLQAISEATRTQARIIQPLARVRHAYTHFKVTAEIFICRHVGGRVRIQPPLTHRWLTLDQLTELPLPKLIHKFLPALKKAFSLTT